MWLKKPWTQLGFDIKSPTQRFRDSKTCIALCGSQQTTPMSKYFDIIQCWVSKKVQENQMRLNLLQDIQTVLFYESQLLDQVD